MIPIPRLESLSVRLPTTDPMTPIIFANLFCPSSESLKACATAPIAKAIAPIPEVIKTPLRVLKPFVTFLRVPISPLKPCEADTTLIMIPADYMDPWLAQYKTWRVFIFENYHNRMAELLKAVDSLTFLNLDERLERYLLDKVTYLKKNTLKITHLEVATDLNSSRVVISRLLKKMERNGKLTLGRNTIQIPSQKETV